MKIAKNTLKKEITGLLLASILIVLVSLISAAEVPNTPQTTTPTRGVNPVSDETPAEILSPLSPNDSINRIKQDLKKLDAYVYGSNLLPENETPLQSGSSLKPGKAKQVYADYLAQISSLSDGLIRMKTRLEKYDPTLSEAESSMTLQELGALTQALSTQHRQLKRRFSYGQEQFESYKLINKAVTELEQAISYWREANKYRTLYRGEAQDKTDDEEILRLKVLSAISAIDQLNQISEMRKALNTLDADTYP